MKIMMVGGINDKKAEKLIGAIKKNIGSDTEVVNVNIFTQKPLEEEEKINPDVIVMLNKQSFSFKAPVVDGLGLIYPQMGEKKVYEELKKHL
ncbi:hypothetical protein [Alkalibacter saccharofermentans]|jgi:hypothetical protein|uniref:PTS system, galactitol-specific IIB component n=1 Tax=Alkalibacter saccharofermentans DSM 14828 TaxID=1120975 RepID=A0A1M4T912_9FIRM|nr:hypothetical protein [Alkalibacter saccharofermentans]SHE40737.1 hypothetical protein SAMN02746064_00415 [Alkalibacter saccharofermentans DSM 14828]